MRPNGTQHDLISLAIFSSVYRLPLAYFVYLACSPTLPISFIPVHFFLHPAYSLRSRPRGGRKSSAQVRVSSTQDKLATWQGDIFLIFQLQSRITTLVQSTCVRRDQENPLGDNVSVEILSTDRHGRWWRFGAQKWSPPVTSEGWYLTLRGYTNPSL